MQSVLNADNLKSSFISIEANKAYDLKTSKGAIIKIAANSFDVPTDVKIDIEIKEAYSVQDMLSAGLTTRSNGKLLQNGGMIYFNATNDNKNVKIF